MLFIRSPHSYTYTLRRGIEEYINEYGNSNLQGEENGRKRGIEEYINEYRKRLPCRSHGRGIAERKVFFGKF
jgi:hypothetical protein